MYTPKAFMGVWPVLGTAIMACTFFAGDVAARDVEVAYQVSAQGLDLKQPAVAREFYAHLQHAAQIVCTHGMRVDLQTSPDPKGCYERALADAIRSASMPLLTQVYLETHSPREAAAHGIDVPLQVAAK